MLKGETIANVIFIYILGFVLNSLSKYVFKLSIQVNYMFKEIKEKNLELKKMASKDYLTNMYNHRSFYNNLVDTIKKLSDNSTFCVAMFDIDNFKRVNDTYGHLTGDYVLKEVSSIIMESISNEDIASRYGGEEFAVLFPGKDLKEAIEICENIRKNIEMHLFEIGCYKIKITISGGVSAIKASSIDACDHCKFIEKVDKLLYKAKKSGKNCIKWN
ncbi:putative diguanylate cyclase YcdT [Clostridium acetireducens DSM 10703]|uniref:Putative diguanylate cyclase YcdT n=1 Tax=Clostridium acetireducens DSM 10703 TaxID=1121290 RepID=A0A1E8EUR8_9CLOT|nr:putative diguanylate cyclase YcdT [Clostridium acetireducens DSM 10703]